MTKFQNLCSIFFLLVLKIYGRIAQKEMTVFAGIGIQTL